jgi:hypothetical protein
MKDRERIWEEEKKESQGAGQAVSIEIPHHITPHEDRDPHSWLLSHAPPPYS